MPLESAKSLVKTSRKDDARTAPVLVWRERLADSPAPREAQQSERCERNTSMLQTHVEEEKADQGSDQCPHSLLMRLQQRGSGRQGRSAEVVFAAEGVAQTDLVAYW